MENEDIYYLNLMGTNLYYHRGGGFEIGAVGLRWTECTKLQQKFRDFGSGVNTEILSKYEYEERLHRGARIKWIREKLGY